MTDPTLAFNHPQGHGRFYRHPAGRFQAVPSITNVMKRQNKPAINGSNVRKAAEFAVDNRDRLVQLTRDEQVKIIKGSVYEKSEASVIGDIVHDWIDRYVKAQLGLGDNPPTPDEVNQAHNSARWTWESFVKFLLKFKDRGLRFTNSEFTVWSNKHGYAGTGDLSMMINGAHILADTKTGKSTYPETGMQLAALANADVMFDAEGHEVPVPHYDRFAVLHLRPRSFSLVPYDNIPAAWDTFLALKRVFDWELTYATQTVGAAPRYN
jgi:hypothetical protein